MKQFMPAELQPVIWDRLQKVVAGGRIGSAYLFSGPPGSGKEALAIEFAKLINCEADSGQSCGICPSCQRINNLQHENLTLIFPLPREGSSSSNDDPLKGLSGKTLTAINEAIKSKAEDQFYKIKIPRANTIPISAIRDIRKTAYLKTAIQGRRVILIFDAHLLSTGEGATANALLKILEEPPRNTSFVLVTDNKSQLLPTILSRCQQLDFPPLPEKVILAFLNSENAQLVTGMALGNMHLVRKLANLKSDELLNTINSLTNLILRKDGKNWREFVNNYSRMASGEPDQFRFNFCLLQLWFRAAYRQRVGLPDALHKDLLLPVMKEFNKLYPAIDYLAINEAITDVTRALARNYYIPLTLTNFLTTVQRRMQGR